MNDFVTKKYVNSDGKVIDVYDNVFTFNEQEILEFFISSCHYQYGTVTSQTTKHLPATFLTCRLNEKNTEGFDFFKIKNVNKILGAYGNLELCAGWFNLSIPGSQYSIHTDDNIYLDQTRKTLTLLYFATTTWEERFGGETFFYNNKLEKEVVVDYKPGRIVVFDSCIPHKPAFSYGHVVGRYVFVSVYKVKQ